MNAQLKHDLDRLREWFDDPKRWTQGALFRKNQREPQSRREDAGCACLVGGCMVITGGRGNLAAAERFEALEDALKHELPERYCSLPAFNDADETKWVDVIELIDRSIKNV